MQIVKPKMEDIIAKEAQSVKSDPKSNVTICDLTPYCIVRLFKYLSVIDMMKFTLIFPQYRDIVRDYIEEDCIDLNQLMSEFTDREIKSIFKHFHRYIREMKITFTEDYKQLDICKLAAQYCHNIDDLTISEMNWRHYNVIEGLFKVQKHLTVLTILHWDRDKSFCRIIARLTNLESLILGFQYNNCGGPYTRKLRHFVEYRDFDSGKFKAEFVEEFMDKEQLDRLEVNLSGDLEEIAYRLMPASVYSQRELKRTTSLMDLIAVNERLIDLQFLDLDWLDLAQCVKMR